MYTLSPKTLTAIVSECDEKKEGKVVMPAQVEHKGQTYAVTEIGDSAFLGCSIQSVVISESVQSIGYKAFKVCGNLTDVFIPKSVTHIGECAFQCYDIGYGDGYTYHYERDDEKDKEVGIKITTEKDAMCFSIPMSALCQHLKLRPDCKISIGERAKSTIRLGDIFEGAETDEGGSDDDVPYFSEEAEYDM